MKLLTVCALAAVAFITVKGDGSLKAGLHKLKARATPLLAAAVGAPDTSGPAVGAGPLVRGPDVPLDLNILVDQFGYRPADSKIAVIRSAREGFDAERRFSPGDAYEVRSVDGNAPVFAAAPVPWKKGSIDRSAGDVGWWFDFSEVHAAGSYYLYDVQRNVRSATFRIAPDVYHDILKAAVRVYYYQRSGFEKKPPFADACWADKAAYLGPGQDRSARDIRTPDETRSEQDLSGGWFDAGDTNKYVTFASQPVHQLLTAYQQYPAAFTDDFDIPESGNGIPDVIDEVRWEIEWLKKMQQPDGTSLLKVGARKHVTAAPPSSDTQPRYYVGSCTSSTIANAAMFAHAARVFAGFPALAKDAGDLKARAVKAFDAYQAKPDKETNCDDGKVLSGDADQDRETQEGIAVTASIYLFAVTGEQRFHDYLKANYRKLQPYKDVGWSRYHPQMGEALLYYTRLPNADSELRATVLADKRSDVKGGHEVYGSSGEDLYRNPLGAQQYHWGSNSVRASYGSTNLDAIDYRSDPDNDAAYRLRALDTLHYFHGVNPFGIVYLTNMYRYGATYSANEVFSSWFSLGTRFSNARTSACGPAPGYLAGGPNANAGKDGVPEQIVPPVGQPPQKSYRDWNKPWPDASYAVTEPSNVYQAGYVKLIAAFVP
ncbi:cellulase-like Ig domain-containing protein [Panacagrimonas perspica]|uniref:Cellulase-like Ig domain-containing protein n=1 Tax=Panacagrimonas perspica TaxID=381431 RepID=A0A4R7P4F2_9GAMM|nr:glycoside hydrolase family 9 protein [Panacagrimonas perspica]TDU28645.1 cellulase-like Ig domain-containing protein [Panacagrimonas perspica]